MKFDNAMSISPGYFETIVTSYVISIGTGVKRL